jgi:hypothetical protein
MAQTPESLIKAQIRAILKKHNVYWAMPIGTGYGNSGVPDFLCCVNGLFIAIEAKSGNNKPTALQNKNIREIQDAGGVALVINETNMADIETHIKLARNIT